MGKGQELYKKAKKLIPGGTMLLSKRPEMFLPENWPAYFSKAKGCEVWDLDGNHYYDMCLMGVGTNSLGYGREEVDEAVMNVVRNGNSATLNNPEEVELAERLCQLDPWAGMVRLCRTGGEANAVAIRIARAASGKDKVAVCGYHGWHDWYIALNIGDSDNIKNYQLSGLEPNGVPKALKGTTLPFFYNKFDELKELVDKNPDLGVIKMEVSRNVEPVDNFLGKVRDLCTERGIILIFDECTSGFRETYGGRYKKFGVDPDMAIYSKAIGNGYAISCIVGKTEIMQAAQSTFISSTFWTERIGPTAAIATLKVMEKERSWEKITAIGLENKRRWQEIADKHGVAIRQFGIPALAGFAYESPNNLAYKTYVTQEMLKKGYLVGNTLYACLAHTPEILDGYFYELDKLFAKIREFEDGRDVMKELDGPVCMTGFQRLN
jgi:glutamate-1-semialdehyde aminotransferase